MIGRLKQQVVGTMLCMALASACSQSTQPTTTSQRSAGTVQNDSGGSGGSPVQCKTSLVDAPRINDAFYPAVTHLLMDKGDGTLETCTGTYVSANAIITAGHCLMNTNNGNIYAFQSSISPLQMRDSVSDLVCAVGGVAALKAVTLGYTSASAAAGADPDLDVAILIMPTGTAPAIMPVALQAPQIGSTVTMVGYGLDSYRDQAEDFSGGYEKRAGTNLVVGDPTAADDALIEVGGNTAAQSQANMGTAVQATYGDSGGPLIYNGQLVGTSRSTVWSANSSNANVYYSEYLAAGSIATQRLINRANAAGANIALSSSSSVPTAHKSRNSN